MIRTLLLALSMAVILSTAGNGQTTVEISVPQADIIVTTDEAVALAGSVIESSLRGVGRMLGAIRGTDQGPVAGSPPDVEDVQVHYDDQHQRYAVTTAAGPRVWVDARSGAYSIDLQGSAAVPGALIEESLASVGSMIRGLRALHASGNVKDSTVTGSTLTDTATTGLGGGPLGLSSVEVERLKRIWRAEGVSEIEVQRRQMRLETADAGFRAAMRALDDSMDQLDREMEALQSKMDDLDHRLGGGGER